MFVLGIQGSPRSGGNTDLLLEAALAGAAAAGGQVTRLRLADLTYSGCLECGGCDTGEACVLDDEMVRAYALLDQADVIILASPIFFAGLSAQAKAMIDRCQVYWVRKYALKLPASKKRVGGLIMAAARLNTDFSPAVASVKTFFLTLDASYGGELLVPGFEEKGSVADDPALLSEAEALGRRLVIVAEQTKHQ
jgi:multimeric flavodoxin WrbA